MKTITNLLLILFVAFLATPTVVSIISKTSDTSYFYSVAEEELTHKEVKHLKECLNTEHLFNFIKYSSSLIISENQLKHDNISPSIFSPPPNA